MTDLTQLTIAEALAGLKTKSFSATDLTRAYLAAMEKGRGLNAYVLETPDKALAMAEASDARIARGEAPLADAGGLSSLVKVAGLIGWRRLRMGRLRAS